MYYRFMNVITKTAYVVPVRNCGYGSATTLTEAALEVHRTYGVDGYTYAEQWRYEGMGRY